jgi:hypothetical protein
MNVSTNVSHVWGNEKIASPAEMLVLLNLAMRAGALGLIITPMEDLIYLIADDTKIDPLLVNHIVAGLGDKGLLFEVGFKDGRVVHFLANGRTAEQVESDWATVQAAVGGVRK